MLRRLLSIEWPRRGGLRIGVAAVGHSRGCGWRRFVLAVSMQLQLHVLHLLRLGRRRSAHVLLPLRLCMRGLLRQQLLVVRCAVHSLPA